MFRHYSAGAEFFLTVLHDMLLFFSFSFLEDSSLNCLLNTINFSDISAVCVQRDLLDNFHHLTEIVLKTAH